MPHPIRDALLSIKGTITFTLCILNTMIAFSLMMPCALFKLLVPVVAMRKALDYALVGLATVWVWINSHYITNVNHTRWSIRGVDALEMDDWYLVVSNHASWVDIAVLQKTFLGRIPFLKFFLKEELIWVPFLGLAWWALDLPFLKRKRGTHGAGNVDLETTRRACEKFKLIPTSVIIFCEGTRFTPAKHLQQRSPYRHLLHPKSGGMAVALATMGAQFHTVLDVTIHYAGGIPTMWDYLSDRVPAIEVEVKKREIPAELLDPVAQQERRYRTQVQEWIDTLWAEKDARLIGMAGETAEGPIV